MINRLDQRRESIVSSHLFDTLADTQMEPADVKMNAGVADLKVLYQNWKASIPVSVTIQTSTGKHRGAHEQDGSRRSQLLPAGFTRFA